MPILDVEIVLRPGEALPETLADLLAKAAAQPLGAAPGRTWVKLRAIDHEHYGEDSAGGRRTASPVFVHVLKSALPRDDERRAEVRRLTETVAGLCDRPPENVHVIYAPAARGRVAFGGEVVG
jgi:phenylpyruvate tautomerase PptA (4-oxalocrotonate tautomerase family)